MLLCVANVICVCVCLEAGTVFHSAEEGKSRIRVWTIQQKVTLEYASDTNIFGHQSTFNICIQAPIFNTCDKQNAFYCHRSFSPSLALLLSRARFWNMEFN